MKIKCISNLFSDVGQRIKNEYCPSTNNIDLKIGKEYLVYAVELFSDSICFCIFDEYGSYFPVCHYSAFFEIVDAHLSRFWVISLKGHNNFF